MQRVKKKTIFLTTMAVPISINIGSRENLLHTLGGITTPKTMSPTTISSSEEPDLNLNCHQKLRLSQQILSTSRSQTELGRKAIIIIPISQSHRGSGFQRREGRYLAVKPWKSTKLTSILNQSITIPCSMLPSMEFFIIRGHPTTLLKHPTPF